MRWLRKQSIIFTLGLLDSYKDKRSTPDDVIDALKVVTKFLEDKIK